MRHGKAHRKLNRTSSHRKAMFKNMVVSLFKHELIRTTLPKAKELRKYAEPMITLAKETSVHNKRLAFSRLRDREIVGKLFSELGPRYSKRAGGYLRILKCGFRKGDNAPMAYVELVERPIKKEEAPEEKKRSGKPKKRDTIKSLFGAGAKPAAKKEEAPAAKKEEAPAAKKEEAPAEVIEETEATEESAE